MNVGSSTLGPYMKAHPPTAIDKVLGRLARFAVDHNQATEDDLICLMILFHTHEFTFSRPIFPTRPDLRGLAAVTRNHAADIVSCAYPQHSPSELWDMFTRRGRGAFEVMDDVPDDLAGRVMTLRAKLLTHPDVALIDPED